MGAKKKSDKIYTNYRLRVKDDTPDFVLLGKDFEEVDSGFYAIEGELVGIKKSFTAAGGHIGDVYGATIFLEDNEGICAVSATITNASKGMINGVLSEKKGTWLKVYHYVNKNGYPTTGCKFHNGEHTKGGIEFDDIMGEDKGQKIHAAIDAWNEKYGKKTEEKTSEDEEENFGEDKSVNTNEKKKTPQNDVTNAVMEDIETESPVAKDGKVFRTDAQSKKIHALSKTLGDDYDYKVEIKNKFGLESSKELTVEQASELINDMVQLEKSVLNSQAPAAQEAANDEPF